MGLDTTSAAILAGGQARRFGGRDKSRLTVDGRPIILRQIEVLQQISADIFVVAPDPNRFADLHLPVYQDRIPGAGALGGVYTALAAAASEFVVTVACDLPFLQAGLLVRLIERAAEAEGAWVRSDRGVEPMLACYRRSTRDAVRAQLDAGRLKAGDLGSVVRMAEIGLEEVERFGPASRLLANINTPEDYARIESTVRP